MNTQEKSLITNAIGKCFLRVVKNHDYYLRFKGAFMKNYEVRQTFFPQSHSTYMNVVKTFERNADKEWHDHFNNTSTYDYITVFINLLLRTFLEASGVDPRKLGMVGQEIFDLSCYQVFGQQFINDMQSIQQKTGVRAPKNEKEAWIVAEYEMLTRAGKKINFDEFMQQRLSIPDDQFWSRSHGGAMEHLERRDDNNDFAADEEWDNLIGDLG